MRQIKLDLIPKGVFLFLTLSAVISCLPKGNTLPEGDEITNEMALGTARNHLEKTFSSLGYNPYHMGIKVSKYYTESNPYMPDEEQINFELEDAEITLKKRYSELKILNDKELIREKEKSINLWKDALEQWEWMRENMKKLKNNTYWTVQFFTIPPSPKHRVLDGSFTVFIESKSGKVIFARIN